MKNNKQRFLQINNLSKGNRHQKRLLVLAILLIALAVFLIAASSSTDIYGFAKGKSDYLMKARLLKSKAPVKKQKSSGDICCMVNSDCLSGVQVCVAGNTPCSNSFMGGYCVPKSKPGIGSSPKYR